MRNELAVAWGLMAVTAVVMVISCSPGERATVPSPEMSSSESPAPDRTVGLPSPAAEVRTTRATATPQSPIDLSTSVVPLVSTEPSEGSPVLVLTDTGCSTTHVMVPVEVPPELIVINEGHQPLVLTVPRFAVSMQLLPGERTVMQINPFIEGTFEYFCLDAIAHRAIGGHKGPGLFACPLDSVTLANVARLEGTLEVERHQEVR